MSEPILDVLAVRCAEARALIEKDPTAAVALANDVLEDIPLDVPLARQVVLTLAEALAAAGQHEELVELERSCRGRWPRFASLRYLSALSLGELGRAAEMVEGFEQCVTAGEDDEGARIVGAGSHLPLYRLGVFSEALGQHATARTCHERALAASATFTPARLALDALDRRDAKIAAVPKRLVSTDTVAMKACRHGLFSYPANDTFIGRSLDLYGEWCEAELETLGALIEPGATVVDVGANIGSHTVFFARRVGDRGCVFAFEPQAFAHGLLQSNITTNGFSSNTRCIRAAVGASQGFVTVPKLDPRDASNFGAVSLVNHDASPSHERVELTTIDALGLDACNLIKIDVEGMECEVLAGARETIARHKPVLFLENNSTKRARDILEAVRKLGYRAYWHIAPYYRENNHFENPENVFAPYQPEANIVCVPIGRSLSGMLEVENTDDNFVKALTRAGAVRTHRVTGPPNATIPASPPSMPLLEASTRDTRQGGARPSGKRPLTIVACIPGREFSGRFFDAWCRFADRCYREGINLLISRRYDAVVYYARNHVLGGDVRRGRHQAPWGGSIDYDFMLWIDSDIIFTFEDFQSLLSRNVELVAGLYLMADAKRFSAVERMSEEVFSSNGQFEFLTPAFVASKKSELMAVDYCGFGFVLAKRGVFERIEYPWFRPVYIELPGGITEFTSEDVGFCLQAKRQGVQMHVDTTVIVSHEKPVLLTPRAPTT